MRHTLLAIFLFIATTAFADDYKILYLSTETITIGGKTLRKGDTFNDKALIKWTLASQSMRIKRINGKGVKIKVVTRDLMKSIAKEKQCIAEFDKLQSSPNNYAKQNIKDNHTSTRTAIKY